MININIKVEAIWHIIIEPDYEIKDKPPFPPKIKVYITIPDTKYAIIESTNVNAINTDQVYYRTGYLAGQSFGFIIKHNPEKMANKKIEECICDLNIKYHLNIDEEYRINLIKNLYQYDYFRYGSVNIKSTEKITLSKEYIEERILSAIN